MEPRRTCERSGHRPRNLGLSNYGVNGFGLWVPACAGMTPGGVTCCATRQRHAHSPEPRRIRVVYITMTRRHGVSKVGILITVACIAILIAFAVPILHNMRRGALSSKDRALLGMIHGSFLVWAESNNGQLPRPGLVNRKTDVFTGNEIDGSGPENVQKNLTRHLYSMMIAAEYFDPEILISCVETNPRVEYYRDYDYSQYQPALDTYWDGDDNVNGAGASGGLLTTLDGTNDEPCHASYAHLALFGQQVRARWRADADAMQPHFSSRMPWQRAVAGPEFGDSYTLQFMGPDSLWIGNVVVADNSVLMLMSYPEGDDELGMTKVLFEQYHEELDQ